MAEPGVAVFGWNPDRYSYLDRTQAIDALRTLFSQGKGFDQLPDNMKAVLTRAGDSFTAPTFAVADQIQNAGIPATIKDIFPYAGSQPERLAAITKSVNEVINDPNIGATVQVGHMPKNLVDRLKESGKYVTRLGTDYGTGGYNQPVFHRHGFGDNAGWNGMYINPAINYDAVYLPGGDIARLRGLPPNQRIVNIGRLANSPFFNYMGFNQNHGDIARALFTTGGGSGAGLPFETRLMGNLGTGIDRSVMLSKEPNTLDFILSALRKKYGDGRFRLDYLTGFGDPNIPWTTKVDTAKLYHDADTLFDYWKGRWGDRFQTPTFEIHTDINNLRHLLDPKSEVFQRINNYKGGPQLLDEVAKRYRGLTIHGRVPQPTMGKFYGNSDLIVDIPGSQVGEVARMYGNNTPGMVHIVPREIPSYPRHFLGNAEVTNMLMQPGAKHNIVRMASPTFAKDLENAIMESGFKNWGRAPRMSDAQAFRPMIEDLKRGLGRSGAMSKLFRVLRRL